ncbi:MAG: polysaccharide export protein [Alteromonadaceae bacterium]|uniref:SLBB domain-containing protein n=1 Tax=Paraglaciecola chathamensis TaxID=368405 RepID=UPI000C492DF7|nr:SLBB domain-containing protein [Paraglaciecola agarilytica]MBN25745.1 polysaccharide export protein [Alteromonadaceae bacterium]|tara:strand:+ start:143222 stop:145990 length:2769 start_codon:yes stop_codon:yes gene_type:complete
MLRTFNFQIIALLAFMFVAPVNAVTPSAQQIEQFKSMPKAQQEALARQMGIDLSDLNLSGGSNSSVEVQPESQVNRYVDDNEIAARLAEQSANKNKTKELKPFGYDLFDSSTATASFAPPTNLPVPADYILGPGDTIRVQLFGKVSEQHSLQVNNEGVIEVPDLGPMNAAGLSYNEFKQQLTQRYSEQVIGVTPNISMGELRTIQVYMVGEAYQPGAYTVSALSTITNALFSSGGINDVGSLRHIELKRAGKTVTEFDLYDLLVFGDTSKDMRLQQGDVIFIPIVKKLVSVDGEVRRPAIYEAKNNDTMASMLNIAGGLLPTAAAKSLQVARSTASDGFEVKTVNMQDRAGRSLKLAAGDFINVPAAGNEFNNAVVVMGAYATPGLTQWRPGLMLSDLVNRNSLMGTTDVDYALIMRGAKFARQSDIIQFEPAKVLSGETDVELNAFDKVVFFNRFTPVDPEESDKQGEKKGNDSKRVTNQQKQGTQYVNNIPMQSGANGQVTSNTQNPQFENTLRDQSAASSSRNNKGTMDDENEEDNKANFLQELDLASFTEKYLILEKTKYLSREELLAPIIERLQYESTQSSPMKLVEITGQVKFPGVYPVQKNATVRDLILAGGGLLESAYLQKAEISRTSLDSSNALRIEHIQIDLIDSMLGNSNIALQSKDTLNVLRTPDWHENKKVELVGEVVFPGVYQIKKGETLAQLIERAGGLTAEATVKAVVFTREELKQRERENLDKSVENLRQQIASTNLSGSQNVKTIDYQEATLILDELLEVEPVGRLVIDMPQIIAGNPTADLSLKDGDKLFVPNISSSVSVVGEVFVPSTHMFKYGKTLEQYIANSGGETDRADMGDVYIVKADGSVTIPETSFWFSSSETALEPGDTIVVPRDVTNYERLGLWQTVTSIVYQSAIALIAIGNL